MNMTTAEKAASKKILAAGATASQFDELVEAGVVKGEFGLTRLGAANLIKRLVRNGEILISLDALNMPTLQTVKRELT